MSRSSTRKFRGGMSLNGLNVRLPNPRNVLAAEANARALEAMMRAQSNANAAAAAKAPSVTDLSGTVMQKVNSIIKNAANTAANAAANLATTAANNASKKLAEETAKGAAKAALDAALDRLKSIISDIDTMKKNRRTSQINMRRRQQNAMLKLRDLEDLRKVASKAAEQAAAAARRKQQANERTNAAAKAKTIADQAALQATERYKELMTKLSKRAENRRLTLENIMKRENNISKFDPTYTRTVKKQGQVKRPDGLKNRYTYKNRFGKELSFNNI